MGKTGRDDLFQVPPRLISLKLTLSPRRVVKLGGFDVEQKAQSAECWKATKKWMPPGRRTILVAEDEGAVRNIIVRILELANYLRMLKADSATEALTVSQCFEGVIDLFITDHSLKPLTGRQVAEQMRQSRPDLKVLHISGHLRTHLESDEGLVPGGEFLAKPFTAQTLGKRSNKSWMTVANN